MSNPNPPSGGPPLRALAMVLIALGIVFAGVGALSLSNSGSDESSSPTSPVPTSAAATTAAASGATTAVTTVSGTTGTVDKSTPVAVYNNGQVQGLARQVADELAASGWSIGNVGNYSESNVPENTVFYDSGDTEQRQIATALAAEIDATTEVKTTAIASLGDGVIVVVVTE